MVIWKLVDAAITVLFGAWVVVQFYHFLFGEDEDE
jgi:hypothetical protein